MATSGRWFVDAQRIVNASVSEPDIDMNRAAGLRARGSRLMAALRWLRPSPYMIDTPRRSVDRELQEYEYSDSWQ
jgi:hypothetical protein